MIQPLTNQELAEQLKGLIVAGIGRCGATNNIDKQVVLYPGEDGYRVAECPSLAGCISQGETREAAIVNIKEAIGEYIAVLEEDGLPVPKERFETLVVVV